MADLILEIIFFFALFFLAPVSVVGFIVQLIRRKKKKYWGIMFLCAVLMLLTVILCILFYHDWDEATCTEPRKCSICGITEGSPVGHSPGEWTYSEPDYTTTIVYCDRYCTVCGEKVDSKIMSLSSLHEDGYFLFSPSEMSERFDLILKRLNDTSDNSLYAEAFTTPALCCGTFDKENNLVSNTIWLHGDEVMDSDLLYENGHISCLITNLITEDISVQVEIMLGLILTCDPQLEMSDASTLAKYIILSSTINEPYYKNGIGYVYGDMEDGSSWFMIAIES